MFKLSAQRLLQLVGTSKKHCRFCRYEEYGGRKMIQCADNPQHNQLEHFGANRVVNSQKYRYVPAPERSLSAVHSRKGGVTSTIRHRDFGVDEDIDGNAHQKRSGVGQVPRGQIGALGWNLANPEFKNQYRWSFNQYRPGGDGLVASKKKIKN